MSRVYPNIVPENNLRLPDALTIKHGPTELLARFALEGDKAVRQRGLRLRLRQDFPELVYLNKHYVAQRCWHPLLPVFNPEYSDLTPETAFWISGEDENGEIALTEAARIFYWPDTCLAEHAVEFFYGRDGGQACRVTAPAARTIAGVVLHNGAIWVRPDFRGKGLSPILHRLLRTCSCARWPVDWAVGISLTTLVENGTMASMGRKHNSYSIFYPGSPLGDIETVVGYTSASEVFDDLADFLSSELFSPEEPALARPWSSAVADHKVTNVSSEGVFQGSSNLS